MFDAAVKPYQNKGIRFNSYRSDRDAFSKVADRLLKKTLISNFLLISPILAWRTALWRSSQIQMSLAIQLSGPSIYDPFPELTANFSLSTPPPT